MVMVIGPWECGVKLAARRSWPAPVGLTHGPEKRAALVAGAGRLQPRHDRPAQARGARAAGGDYGIFSHAPARACPEGLGNRFARLKAAKGSERGVLDKLACGQPLCDGKPTPFAWRQKGRYYPKR